MLSFYLLVMDLEIHFFTTCTFETGRWKLIPYNRRNKRLRQIFNIQFSSFFLSRFLEVHLERFFQNNSIKCTSSQQGFSSEVSFQFSLRIHHLIRGLIMSSDHRHFPEGVTSLVGHTNYLAIFLCGSWANCEWGKQGIVYTKMLCDYDLLFITKKHS